MLRILIGAAVVSTVFFLLAEAGEDKAFLGEAQAEMEIETTAETVECFFPGQIRPLGSTTYVTRGRTIKTTKKECEAQGGKIVDVEEPEAKIPVGEPAEEDDHSPR